MEFNGFDFFYFHEHFKRTITKFKHSRKFIPAKIFIRSEITITLKNESGLTIIKARII